MMLQLTPAAYVIRIFGGVRRTARAIDRSPAAVSKWTKSRLNRGTDGFIPSKAQQRILVIAKQRRLAITPDDLLYGRSVKNGTNRPRK